MKHSICNITTDEGRTHSAQAPVIISASRATDIPAFYGDWFFDRLKKGYIRWRNPFNNRDSYVSFQNTRFIVFWSKNPAPLIPHLKELKTRGINCYVQFTLNDYEHEGFEPNVPALNCRINTFMRLIEILGEGSVVWRFDPLVLTDTIGEDLLLSKIDNIAGLLSGYAEKLVFSFADISSYRKVGRNLENAGVHYREWDSTAMISFAKKLSLLNDSYGLQIATCAEPINLEAFEIRHNRCIDPELIAKLSPNDDILQHFLFYAGSDTGQRKHCGCIISKDIGAYNTCVHGCSYCYANTSPASALSNFRKHSINNDCIIQ